MTDPYPDAPSISDVDAERFWRHYATCPECGDTYGPEDDDVAVMLKARRCYFRHEATPTPDEKEAEAIGMDATLECSPIIGGCGWTEEERLAGHDAREFGKCPDCGRYIVTEQTDLPREPSDDD